MAQFTIISTCVLCGKSVAEDEPMLVVKPAKLTTREARYCGHWMFTRGRMRVIWGSSSAGMAVHAKCWENARHGFRMIRC